jgi:hypothetical protein
MQKNNFTDNPRISELITKFETSDNGETHEDIDKAIAALIKEIAIIHYGIDSGTPEEKIHFFAWLEQSMKKLDTNNPRSNDSEKAIRRLGQSKYGEASKYIENLLAMKKEDFSESQRIRALAKREQNPLNKRILEILSVQPEISNKELVAKLISERGAGLIDDYDEDEGRIWVIIGKGKSMPYSIGGIKNRLSIIKKQLKI